MTKTNEAISDERIKNAINVITRFGGIDGDHHKAWVLDQAVRALFGGKPNRDAYESTPEYEQHVKEACEGDNGEPDEYEWDQGIPP